MNPSNRNFRSLPEGEFPPGLHAQIMRRVMRERFRRFFTAAAAFLGTSLFIATWHFGTALVRAEIPALLKLAAEQFELRWDFIREYALFIGAMIPTEPLVIFLVTLFANSAVAILFWRSTIFNMEKGRTTISPTPRRS